MWFFSRKAFAFGASIFLHAQFLAKIFLPCPKAAMILPFMIRFLPFHRSSYMKWTLQGKSCSLICVALQGVILRYDSLPTGIKHSFFPLMKQKPRTSPDVVSVAIEVIKLIISK